jgi:hypothetical protein
MTTATLDVTSYELDASLADVIVVALASDLTSLSEDFMRGPIIGFESSRDDLRELGRLASALADSVVVLAQLNRRAGYEPLEDEQAVTLTTSETMLLHIASRLRWHADQELLADGSQEDRARFIAAMRTVAGLVAGS